jgi:hypothetical protein
MASAMRCCCSASALNVEAKRSHASWPALWKSLLAPKDSASSRQGAANALAASCHGLAAASALSDH